MDALRPATEPRAVAEVLHGSFAKKMDGGLPSEVRDLLLPLVQAVETLSQSIELYDGTIEELHEEISAHELIAAG